MSRPEFIDQGIGDRPIRTGGEAPTMSPLCALGLSRISCIGVVETIDRGIPLPAPTQKGLEVIGDVVIAPDGELILDAVVGIVFSNDAVLPLACNPSIAMVAAFHACRDFGRSGKWTHPLSTERQFPAQTLSARRTDPTGSRGSGKALLIGPPSKLSLTASRITYLCCL